MGKRKRYSAIEKLKIVLELTHGGQDLREVAAQYQVHPQTIRRWIQHFPEPILAMLTAEAERELLEEKERVALLERKNAQLVKTAEILQAIVKELENSPLPSLFGSN